MYNYTENRTHIEFTRDMLFANAKSTALIRLANLKSLVN